MSVSSLNVIRLDAKRHKMFCSHRRREGTDMCRLSGRPSHGPSCWGQAAHACISTTGSHVSWKLNSSPLETCITWPGADLALQPWYTDVSFMYLTCRQTISYSFSGTQRLARRTLLGLDLTKPTGPSSFWQSSCTVSWTVHSQLYFDIVFLVLLHTPRLDQAILGLEYAVT